MVINLKFTWLSLQPGFIEERSSKGIQNSMCGVLPYDCNSYLFQM
jgi:hypothetical protein